MLCCIVDFNGESGMDARGLDVQKLAKQIYDYEMAYLRSLRENLEPYESIRDAFPSYFLGRHLIEAYLASDGVVVARFKADEDGFHFFPQGIPQGDESDGDHFTIRIGGGKCVAEIAQRLSGWVEFGVPNDGRPYRFDLARIIHVFPRPPA